MNKTKTEILDFLHQYGADVLHTGSRAICDNVPDTSDDDYVILLPKCPIKRLFIYAGLAEYGFEPQERNTDESAANDFKTRPFKRACDNVNLILIQRADADHFEKWALATKWAREQKLCNSRQERIDLFHKVLYGE